MNSTPENVVKTPNSMPEYVALFKKAFPGDKEPVSFDNMAMWANEVFEATLITPDARFDKYLKGDAKALSDGKRGTATVHGQRVRARHGGVNMGGDDYYPLGVVSKPREEIIAGDKGRFAITAAKDDEFAFKSPSLRNIELTPPYFHSGVVWSLEESIEVMNDSQVGAALAEGYRQDRRLPAHHHRQAARGGPPDPARTHRHHPPALAQVTGRPRRFAVPPPVRISGRAVFRQSGRTCRR